MSTPVHQLPSTGGQSATAPPMDDPEVLSMLNEMEVEVQEATKQQHVAARAPSMPAVAHIPAAPPAPVVKKATPKGLWNMETAQKAAIYAVIASILFYPATLKFIYGKIPKFENIFTSYDVVIRTVLLAVVIYFAMMYLPF